MEGTANQPSTMAVPSNLTLKQLLWGLKAEGPGSSTHYKDI